MKDITEFKTDIFTLFDRGWALLTAGTQERWNTMTVSWGALGTLWGLPAATVYVKPVRYTHRFMDAGDIFTLAFFFGERRGDLSLLGTKLGREVNKVALTSLTPVEIEGGMSFKEAPLTLICRKMYRHDLERAALPQSAIEKYYEREEPHTLYIGQVLGFVER